MSKIDLISGNWANMVFADRNKAYGAYALRQGTGKRNLYGILFVLVVAVLIFIALGLYNQIQERNAKLEAEMKAAQLKQMEKEAKAEEKKAPEKEIKVEYVQEVQSSVKFTAPVIKEDNQVTEKDEINLVDVDASEAKVGAFNVEGNSDAGEVLKATQEIAAAPEPPKQEPAKIVEDKPFDVVEQMPSFPGGDAALMKYLASHIKYPAVAEENGIQGRVIVQFVVTKTGSIDHVKILKGVDPSLDKEAARVVGNMPNWIPGKQNGQAVAVNYRVPVTFKLQQ